MIKIVKELDTISDFDGWCGANETIETIIEAGKDSAFMGLMEELYPEGLTDTELNDLLRFESDWIYKSLGIEQES